MIFGFSRHRRVIPDARRSGGKIHHLPDKNDLKIARVGRANVISTRWRLSTVETSGKNLNNFSAYPLRFFSQKKHTENTLATLLLDSYNTVRQYWLSI